MPFTILKSQADALGFDYEAAVAVHLDAVLFHRFEIDVPAPTAHPFVAAAIARIETADDLPDDYVADYEIIDDTPPPPTLEQKKTALYEGLQRREAAEIAAIAGPGKQRLAQIDAAAIRSKPNEERSPQEVERLAEIVVTFTQIAAAQRIIAERMAEVDDLTEETVDGFDLG